MKKCFTKVLSMLIVVVTIFSCVAIPANAAYSYYGSYQFRSGLFWLKKNTVQVETDPTWWHVFYGNAKVSTGFEYKNNTSVELQQTRSFSISKQTTKTLNTEVDFSDYGVPAKVGGTMEYSSAKTFGIANTTVRTIEKSAPKGYYSYNVCLNTTRVRLKLWTDGSYMGRVQIFAPRSEAYRAIVYNPTNAVYSNLIQY